MYAIRSYYGIAQEDGAPEIKGFAIQGTTHADYASATNTGSTWGHWWNADGDVVNWGTTAMVFAEFDYDEGYFNVGQYPGHLTDEQTVTVIECLKYNEKRVRITSYNVCYTKLLRTGKRYFE